MDTSWSQNNLYLPILNICLVFWFLWKIYSIIKELILTSIFMGLFCRGVKVLREHCFFILAVFFHVRSRQDRSVKEGRATYCFVCLSWWEKDFKLIVNCLFSWYSSEKLKVWGNSLPVPSFPYISSKSEAKASYTTVRWYSKCIKLLCDLTDHMCCKR